MLRICQIVDCRSENDKALSTAVLVISRNINSVAFTETWFDTCPDGQVLSRLQPSGLDTARPDERSGGAAVLF